MNAAHTGPANSVDFSRHEGLLDHDLLSRVHIACVGVGGAAGLVATLARAGIAHWTLVDFDCVSATNPSTQAHDLVVVTRNIKHFRPFGVAVSSPDETAGTE